MGNLLQATKLILKAKLITLSVLLLGSLVLAPAATAAALPLNFASAGTSAACGAISQLDSSQACGSGQSTINRVVKSVLQIISFILGIAGIIMVVVAGFKYITSNGDTGAVGSAKRTLIYALVGLVVAALAQFMVHYVIAHA